MSKVAPPPLIDKLVDKEGIASLAWTLFFTQMYSGDTGTAFTPEWTSLTEVGGSASFDAIYYKIGSLVFFRVTITPVTNTSATAGTTTIDNFPLTFKGDGVCFAVTAGVGGNAGHVAVSGNKIYVPGWTTIATALTVVGIAEAG